MKNKNIKFVIFCNRSVGEVVPAKSPQELIENMTKRHAEFWSDIKFKDEADRTIMITREFLEQGMTIDSLIENYIANADEELLNESIHTL